MFSDFLILATLDTLGSLSRNSHSVLFDVSTSRHSLSRYQIHRSYTQTHTPILLIVDVRPEGLARNSLSSPGLTFSIVYAIRLGTSAVEHQGKSWALSQNCLSHIYDVL